jgi:hypothetical protein
MGGLQSNTIAGTLEFSIDTMTTRQQFRLA